ncbi:orotate phosphoribosyltransferase [Nocardioides hungaricus]
MISHVEEALNLLGLGALQSTEERRAELADDILAAAHLRGEFVLSSGETTDYYLDKYLFETKPTILRRLASLMAAQIPSDVDRLVGPELSGVPVVVALALESGLPYAIVRRRTAGSGARSVEGELHLGERVLVVEDVISTGQRALTTVERVREVGAQAVSVMAVVDRLQGAAAALAAVDLPLTALLTIEDLLGAHGKGEGE